MGKRKAKRQISETKDPKGKKKVVASSLTATAIEKGLSEMCLVPKNGATAKFLANNSDKVIVLTDHGLRRQRKKERCHMRKLQKGFKKMNLSRSSRLSEPESDIPQNQSIDELPIKFAETDFFKNQKDSKKCFKKMFRKERSKQRRHKSSHF